MPTLAEALATVKKEYSIEEDDFTNGDCHTLAEALYCAMGHQGKLLACLRETLEVDGSVFATGYSHMVYQAPDGTCWDIGGCNADFRWEDSFDLDTADKWGLTTRFRWEAVSHEDLYPWLQQHHGCIDEMRVAKVTRTLKDLLHHAEASLNRSEGRHRSPGHLNER